MPLSRLLLFWFAFVSYPVLRGDEPDRLVVIRDAFAREMEKVGGESNQKRWDLKNGYLKSLNRLLEANISSGNSEIVLSLNDEISMMKSPW